MKLAMRSQMVDLGWFDRVISTTSIVWANKLESLARSLGVLLEMSWTGVCQLNPLQADAEI